MEGFYWHVPFKKGTFDTNDLCDMVAGGLCWLNNRLVKSKPVKQEASCKVIFILYWRPIAIKHLTSEHLSASGGQEWSEFRSRLPLDCQPTNHLARPWLSSTAAASEGLQDGPGEVLLDRPDAVLV